MFHLSASQTFLSLSRRGSRINGDRFPKQRVPSRWAPLRNVLDFFFPKVPFLEFLSNSQKSDRFP